MMIADNYVLEKLEHAIVNAHRAYRESPDGDVGDASRPPDAAASAKSWIRISFGYATLTFLALLNQEEIANDNGYRDRLLAMTEEQLNEWLQRIWRGGDNAHAQSTAPKGGGK